MTSVEGPRYASAASVAPRKRMRPPAIAKLPSTAPGLDTG